MDITWRYPIGEFECPGALTAGERSSFIERIRTLPDRLDASVDGLDELQLDTPYRPEGWTIREVVHHIADSQVHGYLRFKYALAEDGATITAFPEDIWVHLADTKGAPVGLSLAMTRSIHDRWSYLLDRLGPADFERSFSHPDKGHTTLDKALAFFAWHGDHHTAQITGVRKRMGW